MIDLEQRTFATETEAKFAREAQDRPTEWAIKPVRGKFELTRVARRADYDIETLRATSYGLYP